MRATDPSQLDLGQVVAALRGRELSSRELVAACLRRIDECDGPHSFDGSPDAINAWIRVYREDAEAAAVAADERRAEQGDDAPALCGVPFGLKDLIGAAGHPLTASSRVVRLVPARDSAAWGTLRGQGAVLLGHCHTHEFGAGGTTDQVGNPWALDRSAGGSSGGNAAAIAARMVPAGLGTDSAGSLRIPAACCGVTGFKPTYVPLDDPAMTPLTKSLTQVGPMARTVADCALVHEALDGGTRAAAPASPRGLRIAIHPRAGVVDLHADVAAGLDRAADALRQAGAQLVTAAAPPDESAVGPSAMAVLLHEVKATHDAYAFPREGYRPSTREVLEQADERAIAEEQYRSALALREVEAARWERWFADERVDMLLEPTIPVPAPSRGHGYDAFFTQDGLALISLTRIWNWTGLPVLSLPAGLAPDGVPVGVSLVAPRGRDWDLLDAGTDLQETLGVPSQAQQ
jgi:aspartyl-tRNA(Asn)/glutamyl-tRNA(Gln) amidotransferase subunit A